LTGLSIYFSPEKEEKRYKKRGLNNVRDIFFSAFFSVFLPSFFLL